MSVWKATAGAHLEILNGNDDDWDTDPDFVNDVSEQEQRWGSRTVEGSGRTAGSLDMKKLREETAVSDAQIKQKQWDEGPKAAFGYGGKFGVQADRMDKTAVGHDYIAKVEKHGSQKDYSTGFGGKFGVQTDRKDKSAVGWEHKERLEKHASQKDYSTGFGGKFGLQTDRQDKSAVGWDHLEKVEKHESQKDYAVGFGGKFGIQADRQDKSAVGWEHKEQMSKHESQTDHKKGFGGKYGLQNDRVDKSAHDFNESPEKIGTNYEKAKPDIGSVKPSKLREKFESLARQEEEEGRKKAAEEKQRRTTRELEEQAEAKKQEEMRIKQQKARSEEMTNGQVPDAQNHETEQAVAKDSHAVINNKTEVVQNKHQVPEKMETPHHEESALKESASDASHDENPHENISSQTDYAEVNTNTVIDSVMQYEEESLYSAVALYDYQAAADDEISFDPDDIITNIEMIDEGWWRGICKGQCGLFPANYVQLQ